MNRNGVLSDPRPDSQETSPLLNAYSDHLALAASPLTENTGLGGSALDGAALHRNEQDGKNIVRKTSLLDLGEYQTMQAIMGRHMITSLKTNDN
jgi:hypothetical protein